MMLAYLYGEPRQHAQLKAEPQDFIVQEVLGYDMAGEGEFVAVYVRKTDCNTLFVGEKLAKFAGISQRDWSYAGLKDRHGVTEQWFCLHLPGKPTPDFSTFALDGVEILQVTRHNRKIRIGSLQGNRFAILLRGAKADDDLLARLENVQKCGFANYFTEQRFGREGNNLTQAERWAKGEISVRDRKKRSFYLSAARSELFNQVVSARIDRGLAGSVLRGDAVQLAGSHSWFIAHEDDLAATQQRLDAQDVQLTAPMMGEQGALSEDAALAFEQGVLAEHSTLCQLLSQARLKSDRRALRVQPRDLQYRFDAQGLHLRFTLPAGSYATALVRELVHLEDEGM